MERKNNKEEIICIYKETDNKDTKMLLKSWWSCLVQNASANLITYTFLQFLRWKVTILWSHWYFLFQTYCFRLHLHSALICMWWMLRVTSDFRSQGLVPILHVGMVRLPLEWPPNVTSGTADRGRIRSHLELSQPALQQVNLLEDCFTRLVFTLS